MKVLVRKGYLWWTCPASICGNVRIPIEGPTAWKWNESIDTPTITPSVKITWDYGEERKSFCCHCVITNGQIVFCSDCTHELSGQTVLMADINPVDFPDV
jgi:hypothetical protein